jgi:hypothetical protein
LVSLIYALSGMSPGLVFKGNICALQDIARVEINIISKCFIIFIF